MTQPQLAHATDFGRMYSRQVGGLPEVPSITTVIGQAPPDLAGWAGHMAATAVVQDARLGNALGSPAQLRSIARDASSAAERYRDEAAARGDRVHAYAEQVALRQLGQVHDVAGHREVLKAHGEGAFADRFDEWWDAYEVQPLAPEITVWNHEVGYAGTLDLVAKIGGRVCLIDYKTKGTSRDGRVKPLDPKVVMQLAAGAQAQEQLVDGARGAWEPWPHAKDVVLLGVALGETEVLTQRAQDAVLPASWRRFWALRQVWEAGHQLAGLGPALRPVPPPAGA
ncbi:cytochrome [Galactobacter valiniphilus]|uniref:Cytochrome n=1 Tax=Galactobacter valiniphilus TaxID=2676122 RepID=A0A399J814_9MICC|nr:cytochrome [Galactobacter valiniphilus]RII41695.1 cytochrome [Galactobacter valiniphilus]